MAVYLADARQALANLMGEETVSTSWPSSRDNALNWSLERIARYYDFDFGKKSLNITTNSSGQYTFLTADGVRRDPDMDVRILVAGASNDHIFTPVDQVNFDNYSSGDYVYYLSTDATGAMTLVTSEPNSTLAIRASRIAPTLSSTVPSEFPSALAIAKGALIYIREFEDKDADTSVEDAKFQQIVQEVIGAEQRAAGPRRAVTRQEMRGRYTGDVRSDMSRYR